MPDDPAAKIPSHGGAASSKDGARREKPATSWLIPAITAAVLAAGFCLYYFVYVAAQREYLANRNFRSLAVLGAQVQEMISIHGSILEFSADLADSKRKLTHREKDDLDRFLVVHGEDKSLPKDVLEKEARKDYLKYLAPNFELMEKPVEHPEKPSKPKSRFEVRRRNGKWELLLTAQTHEGAIKDYAGSLEIDGMLKPFVGSLPFDDIILVSETGTIVYQSNKAGPRFTTLTSLLQAQPDGSEAKPAGKAADAETESGSKDGETSERTGINPNADRTWRTKSKHLTDLELAGTRYKLFLQPILVDVYSDEPSQSEPAREWVLCGLQSAKALDWEALSISSTFIIWFTALFLAICMSGPVFKVLFMNKRERFRLRELGFLGLFLVLLTSVFTFSGLEAVVFPQNDNTDAQLKLLGDKLSGNIHQELRQMREQLIEWCADDNLRRDFKIAENHEVIRNTPYPGDPPSPKDSVTPRATKYPYVNNAFWTDDDGRQIVKWSTSSYLTPMIDISQSRMYTHPKSTYLDGKGPPFHFDSVRPPNKLEYLASLTMTTEDCNPALLSGIRGDVTGGSAFLTAQPLSLIDPILPLDYGFALLDETGLVLFHADKTKNIHENFLQESDWSKQLYAAAFGHSNERSLRVKYRGKDYQARVMPVMGVSQAPWSLIVYRDLTSVRTLNLQAMTMASSLLLMILAGPVLAIAVWCAIRRPRFAPEWLWPNRARTGTYMYQSIVYAALIILFLLVGFTGSIEQNAIACVILPCAALLLTFWCFRTFPPKTKKPPGWRLGISLPVIAFLLATIWQRAHLHVFEYLLGFGIIVVLPLLDQPRHYLAIKWKRSFHWGEAGEQSSGDPEAASYAWRKWYIAAALLLLLLVGVLLPMALFRASLAVERRLGIKQAQLHLASALEQRLISTSEECDKRELGQAACDAFKKNDSSIWGKVVLDPLFPADGKLPIERHRSSAGRELYTGWFQHLVYALHHDYNQGAAEMLGVIPDRANPKPGDSFPDWAWGDDGRTMTLRWHGIDSPSRATDEVEDDLLIQSPPVASSWTDGLSGAAVAAAVMVFIGLLVWALVRKIFLFHIAPLNMTGARKVVESIREGRNVVVLVPPVSDWRLDVPKSTMDLREMAAGPKWAEILDLDKVSMNTLVEIRHFEYSTNDVEIDNQKFTLLERLLKRENTQLAVVLIVPVSSEDYRRMFPAFEVIDLREDPFYWLKKYEGPARDIIWKECGPMPALWPIGAQLAKDLKPDEPCSEETVASEILERADGYYQLVWKECSHDQKFALAQLAEDGLLNPMNGRAIRQLARRGLVTEDPQFRLMNESFRRFLRSHTSAELKRQWLRESRRSGWGKMHGAFFTTMLLLGVFLLTTQNELWQSSAAYVTTALGALGTLSKLFNTYRGGGSGTEKAG